MWLRRVMRFNIRAFINEHTPLNWLKVLKRRRIFENINFTFMLLRLDNFINYGCCIVRGDIDTTIYIHLQQLIINDDTHYLLSAYFHCIINIFCYFLESVLRKDHITSCTLVNLFSRCWWCQLLSSEHQNLSHTSRKTRQPL